MMLSKYLETISLIERVRHQYLDLVKRELDAIGAEAIDNLRAVILFNVGDARIAINEVRTRGNYLGSNTSYIIKKLIEDGYLSYARSEQDRRVVEIWLSDKGRRLCGHLARMHDRQISALPRSYRLQRCVRTLQQIEQLWIDEELDPPRLQTQPV